MNIFCFHCRLLLKWLSFCDDDVFDDDDEKCDCCGCIKERAA